MGPAAVSFPHRSPDAVYEQQGANPKQAGRHHSQDDEQKQVEGWANSSYRGGGQAGNAPAKH